MKTKGRRQSSNVEVATNNTGKQGRTITTRPTVVTAPSIGMKAGRGMMDKASGWDMGVSKKKPRLKGK